jgi:hypothetical protein
MGKKRALCVAVRNVMEFVTNILISKYIFYYLIEKFNYTSLFLNTSAFCIGFVQTMSRLHCVCVCGLYNPFASPIFSVCPSLELLLSNQTRYLGLYFINMSIAVCLFVCKPFNT